MFRRHRMGRLVDEDHEVEGQHQGRQAGHSGVGDWGKGIVPGPYLNDKRYQAGHAYHCHEQLNLPGKDPSHAAVQPRDERIDPPERQP